MIENQEENHSTAFNFNYLVLWLRRWTLKLGEFGRETGQLLPIQIVKARP